MDLSLENIKAIINDDWLLMDDCEGNKNCNVVKELARIALASLEAQAVAYMCRSGQVVTRKECCDDKTFAICCKVETPLYTAPPAAVVPAEFHPDTQKLVTDFCTALAEKLYKAQLKYGYDADWKQDGWPTQCQAHFHQHIAKGDPRDVAAYCAFMWYHGWKTEPAPVSVPDESAVELLATDLMKRIDKITGERHSVATLSSLRVSIVEACRAAMLQGAEPVKNHDELREKVRREHAEWSQATFGDVGPVGPLKHLSKEALEAAAEPRDLSEWADMQFLLWDAQRRAGISDGEITAAMEEKLKVNMARQWPEPKDGEPRLHIKAAPQQEVTQALAKGMERYGDAMQKLADSGD
ncbi:hypothetical protein AI2797V1_3666 [Enterobacter cloacae]|nr:hypothetical protein AI2797V1_3666 [Enterobacter cloacae]CAE7822991.1 hypothetical protein AI2802V1_3652 [Enterobacter cloacae]CAH3840998.1 hypothetical protein AI2797V1_3666 [Enterobacter cloacae]CAH4007291.1 hypothetical protein AI2802V1_3652 [Enterobacter cloacae]